MGASLGQAAEGRACCVALGQEVSPMGTWRELWAAALDAMREGDWAGHWRAWWLVATRRIRPSDRWGLAL
ncbi:hypothetical protein ES705_31119 [subsurface metagenome]